MSKVLSETVIVEEVGEIKTYGDNGFKKQSLITTKTDGEYTNYFVFEFVQDKTDLLKGINVGDEIIVSFNIRCRKVEKFDKEDMYFTSLSGWKIDRKQG